MRKRYDMKDEQGQARSQVAPLENLVDVGFEPDEFVQLATVHSHHAVYKLRAVPAARQSPLDNQTKRELALQLQ